MNDRHSENETMNEMINHNKKKIREKNINNIYVTFLFCSQLFYVFLTTYIYIYIQQFNNQSVKQQTIYLYYYNYYIKLRSLKPPQNSIHIYMCTDIK